MTGIVDLNIELEDDEVKAALNRLLLATGGEMADPMRQISRMLLTSTQLRFRDGKDPDGKPWVPSKRVLAHGGKTLRLSGRLRNSFVARSDSHTASVGTNVVYAKAIHFGRSGTEQVKPFTRKVTVVFGRRLSTPAVAHVGSFTRRLNLPSRRILGASVQDKADIMAIISRSLFKAIGTHVE